MRHFVFRWIVTTIAVFVAAPIVGINYGDRLGCLLGASLLLGIINAFIRPVLLLLSLPLILVTLGVFILIINALMLKFVGEIMPCFEVPGFWRAFFGAIVISIVSWLLSAFFRGSDGRVHVLTHHSQIKRVRGRVIDVNEEAVIVIRDSEAGSSMAIYARSRSTNQRIRRSAQILTEP